LFLCKVMVVRHPGSCFGKSSAVCSENSVLSKKFNLGTCIEPTWPFRADLGTVSRVCYLGNIVDRQPQWALVYCYLLQSMNSKSERKVALLPLLGLEPATFGMLAHLSDHSAKSHPLLYQVSMHIKLHPSSNCRQMNCSHNEWVV
jgi:hypothetical protein